MLLAGCDGVIVIPTYEAPLVTPRPTPRVVTPATHPLATETHTPTRNPSGTPVHSPTHTLTFTSSPTVTATSTATFTPSATATDTATPAPQLNLLIPFCDTGLDIFNGLGEVTNAYALVQNVGPVDLTGLLITLSATDEEQLHPNKSYTIQFLPQGYEIALKLTVDTASGIDSSILINAASPVIAVSAVKDPAAPCARIPTRSSA